ncbi:MAG: two-component system cell cycle sensor histidine kinase/response regulator CckA [Planctomycetota bacterium]|jgi:two-component system cell cycle sensor histidine kinase/response regulator CckA
MNSPSSADSDPLRQLAEDKMRDESTSTAGELSMLDSRRLVHELQIHQIELKAQNEELRNSQSDLEAALTRYTDFYDFAPVSYYALDRSGTILQTNLPGARLLGTSRSLLVGSSLRDFIAVADRSRLVAFLQETFAEPDHQIRTLQLTPKGAAPIQVQIEGTRSPDGTELRTVIFDISAQTRAAAEREELQEQLFQSLKMDSVGQLAGGVAHDFNNTLAAIMGHAEMALMEVGSEQPVRKELLEMRGFAEQSADLIAQLLAFASRQPAAPRALDLNKTVEQTLNLIRPLIGEGTELVWRPGKEALVVKIDPAQIDQVVVNLCINARDAITDTGTIVVETQGVVVGEADWLDRPNQEASSEEFVSLIVRDTGTGMSPDTQSRIFEPFFTTKGVGKGTGLGLSTAYGVIKQNGGSIKVESQQSLGTSFMVYLPRCHEVPEESEPSPASEKELAGRETILLVEDESSILELTRRMLEGLGYQVIASQCSVEAVRLVAEHAGEIHMLVTDIVMPKLNGQELATQLNEDHPGIKILYMSGYTADIIAERGLFDPGVNFIQKPFRMKLLAERVRAVLDGMNVMSEHQT